MGKKKQGKTQILYLCPHCGNEAPWYIQADKPWRCHYCKQVFYKADIIKEKK